MNAVAQADRSAPAATRRGALSARRSLTALADQGSGAAASLALNVLLARWAGPEAYGAFAVMFGILLMVTSVQTALVLEPMSVLGPSRFSERLGAYLRAVRSYNHRLTLPAATAAAGIAVVWTVVAGGALPGALFGMAVALPAVSLHWFVRRASYTRGDPGVALRANLGYALGVAAGMPLLAARPTPLMGFLIMGAAAGAPAVWTIAREKPDRGEPVQVEAVRREHWAYGRWMIAAAVVTVTFTYGQTLIAGALTGLADAGALRAMQVITLPVVHASTAIAMLAMPAMAADHARARTADLLAAGRLVRRRLVLVAVAYEALLVVAHGPIEAVLFDGRYADRAWLLPILGLAPLAAAVTTASSLVLRALRKPEHYVIAAAVTAPVGLASSVMLTLLFGVGGTAASIVLTAASTMLVAAWLVRRWLPQEERS